MIATSTGDPIIDLLLNGTPYAILVAIIIAFYTGRILPKSQVDKLELRMQTEITALREERDSAIRFMQAQAELAQRALEVTEKVRG